ncbi:MAG: cell division protein FtsA [Bacteroidaceae bacterium]|nr:cell division protein FtsA [Bacteroidaceae bacterium]
MTTDKDFIVAIELGSSKIAGIAGRKKDGTMHVLAYAEEKTTDCVKRGVVYNIEKTYQCINTVVSKLETVLKTKITRAYVGVGGQSLRSFNTVVKRNMLTQSYITNETIDSIRLEGYEIPFSECEVLENFPQEYVVDSNVIADPVGVMGTNIEGCYLNVIANVKLRGNITTCFDNLVLDCADELVAPYELAKNVLTDAEKRSGCVLVDLGADTTTVIVYKNNIVRHLVTIPLGSNNINKDLSTLQIDEAETEDIKLKFGDAIADETDIPEDAENQVYTTSDGRQLEVANIKHIIEARLNEIIANVSSQIVNSNYSGKLLAGIILTGGGSNMKNIDKAFLARNKFEKVRIAKTTVMPVVKTSGATGLVLDSGRANTLVSLLLAGNQSCGGDAFDGMDIFSSQKNDEAAAKAKAEAEAKAKAEADAAIAFDEKKADIRKMIDAVRNMRKNIEENGKDKKVRLDAAELVNTAMSVIDEDYEKGVELLSKKDKYKQSIKEGAELKEMLGSAVEALDVHLTEANKKNSPIGRFKTWINDIVNEAD